MNVVLELLRKAGLTATPEHVNLVKQAVLTGASPNEVAHWEAEADELLALMAALTSEQEPPRRAATTEWRQATEQPASTAALGALHDRLIAPHTPGGKVRRPRWSADEAPWEGWWFHDRERPVSSSKPVSEGLNEMLAMLAARKRGERPAGEPKPKQGGLIETIRMILAERKGEG